MKSTTVLLSLVFPLTLFAQMQLGADINGSAVDDRFGWCTVLSADGRRVAAGSPYNDAGGSNAGHVRVFELLNNDWVQVGQTITGLGMNDRAGSSVALSADGNIVAVGAPNHNANGALLGSARVFRLENGVWTPLGEPLIGDTPGGDFGFYLSLSADGSRLAVGAPIKTIQTLEEGEVTVYEWQNDEWIQMGQPMQGASLKQRKGWHVSLSADGKRVVSSAPWSPPSPNMLPGYVEIHEWQNGDWIKLGSTLVGKHGFDLFGWGNTISSDGNRVAVGAMYNEETGFRVGSVRTFEWQNGDWQPLGEDLYGDHPGNQFGSTVSFGANGNRLAIGGYGNSVTFPSAGHGRLLEWNGNAWVQVAMDVTGEAESDLCGNSISLSADGRRMAIDASYHDGNGANSGQVRVFEFPPSALSNQETTATTLTIAPNPSSDWIELKGFTTGIIRVTDLQGRNILHQADAGNRLNVSDWPAGIYLVEWLSEAGWVSGKFVKAL